MKYNIFKGTYNCRDWRLVGAYKTKARFIKALKRLGYEKYWGEITTQDTQFQEKFGEYTIVII